MRQDISFIEQLNQFITEGIELQQKLIVENRKYLFKSIINIKRNNNKVRTWIHKVTNFLKNNYPQHEYYGYFIKQPKEIKKFPELTWPSSVLIPDFSSYIDSLENILIKIGNREDTVLRKDLDKNEDILYEIQFNENNRVLMFNNTKLAHPNSDSKTMNFFEYVYKNSNQKIAVSDIEDYTSLSLSNNINDILRDLRFVGSLRTVFFPIVTKNNVFFRNPITKKEFAKSELPLINLLDLTRNNET